MKKLLYIFTFFIGAQMAFSQESDKDDSQEKSWTMGGNVSVLFNQSFFENWAAGGENTISGTLGVNYDLNYLKDDWSWDTKLVAAYGITKIKNQDRQKTDDRLEITSTLGKKASKYWYYSLFFNGKTQFDVGYNPETGIENSHGFSPLYLQLGPGMLWKYNENLRVNITPLSSRFIIVHNHFTDFGKSFGVEQGKTLRYELGASLNVYYKFNIMENVSMENILNAYSNYIENPLNIDLDYTMNIVMRINKYLSANLSFQTIYDDNAYKGFQVREVFGLGVNFGL